MSANELRERGALAMTFTGKIGGPDACGTELCVFHTSHTCMGYQTEGLVIKECFT